MKRMIIAAMLGTASAYSSQSTTTTTITTTATTTPPTTAFIYHQLVTNGVGHEDALTQAQQWHPPLVIPFTNPTNEDQAPDNAE